MPHLQDSPELYQLWQSQLLAEMGVERWASQNSPVMEFLEQDFQQFLESEQVSANNHDVYQTVNSTEDETVVADFPSIIDSTLDSFQENQEHYISPVIDEQFITFNDDDNILPDLPNTSTPDIQQTTIVVERFAVQMIVYHQWVLLVDEQFLQSDSQQAKLWQSIQQQLKAESEHYRFPLLDDYINLPKIKFAMMHDEQMAVAGFKGFLHLLTKRHDISHNYRLGALTPMLNCLESDPIHRLPHLSEMIKDYRQKRQFWRLLVE